MDAEISDVEAAAPSSSWQTQNSFLSSTMLSDSGCKYCFTEKNLQVMHCPLLQLFHLRE